MEDRRKFPRLDTTKLKILWRKVDTLDNLDNTKNISAGGVCFAIERREVEAGDVLQLEFGLPTGKMIYTRARVVWVEERGEVCDAGIEFLNISDGDREEIGQFVSGSLPKDENSGTKS